MFVTVYKDWQTNETKADAKIYKNVPFDKTKVSQPRVVNVSDLPNNRI